MRERIGALLLGLLVAVLSSTVLTSPALAEEHDFKATVVYRITSLQQIGDQLFIDVEGGGVSRLLGPFTATASAIQTVIPGACDPVSGDATYSASGGTIDVHFEDLLCPQPDKITGAWFVTAGTGEFAGASGSGTETGKAVTSSDPLILHLEGTLSF